MEEIKGVSAKLYLQSAKKYSKPILLNSSGVYNVYKINGTSEINKIYDYTISFVSDIELEQKEIINTQAKLVLKDKKHLLKMREIHGQISDIKLITQAGKRDVYQARLVSPFKYLYQNKKYEIYQDMSVIDIITKIIKIDNLTLDVEIENKLDTKTFPKREFCIQYNQSDADFIMMLSYEEKFSITFNSTSSKPYKITLSNINEHAKKLKDPIICNFHKEVSFKPTFEISNFYDFEKPSLNYLQEQEANLSTKQNAMTTQLAQDLKIKSIHERLDLHNGLLENDIKRYTKLNATKHYVSTNMILANSNDIDVNESLFVKLTNKKEKEQESIIIKTDLVATFPYAIDEYKNNQKEPYAFNTQFLAIPAEIPLISQIDIKKPIIATTQTAIVANHTPLTAKDENKIDTDKLGRAKVIFHFQAKKAVSCYLRLGTPFSGNSWGAQFLPRANTEVIINFINGNINKPIITSALYNGDNELPYSLPSAKTKTYIQTSSTPQYGDKKGYNELLFEDKNSQERLSLRAQKNYKIYTLNNSKISIDNNQEKTIKNNENIKVEENYTTKIKSAKNLDINITKTLIIGTLYSQLIQGIRAQIVALKKLYANQKYHKINIGATKLLAVKTSNEEIKKKKKTAIEKRFQLIVSGNSLIVNDDGTILMGGKKINIQGSKKVAIHSEKFDLD